MDSVLMILKKRYKWLILLCGIFFGFMVIILNEYKNSDTYIFPLDHLMTNSSYNDGVLTVSENISDGSEVYNTGAFWLSEGFYVFDISYSTSIASRAEIIIDNDQMNSIALLPENNLASIPIIVTHPSDRAKIMLFSDSGSDLSVTEIRMTSDHRIYTDAIYHFILLVIVFIAFVIIVIKLPEIRSYKDVPVFLYIGLFVFVVSFPLLFVEHAGSRLCIDTRSHMLRIEGIAKGLYDGQFPVIIAPNYFNEYGQLTFMYPNVFLYPFALLRFLNVSMTAAYRTMAVSVNILTAVFTYKASCVMFPKRKTRLIVTLLYLVLPYRMMIMLNSVLPVGGGAAGSGIADAFLPLIIAGCYLLINNNNTAIRYLVPGISGVLNSHILSMLIVSCFLLTMLLINIRSVLSQKLSRLIIIVKTIVLTIVINLGFLAIFLIYYFSDWDKKRILWGDFVSALIDVPAVLATPRIWLYITAIFFAFILLYLNKNSMAHTNFIFALELTVIASVVFLMTTRLVPWKSIFELFPTMKVVVLYLQFPDRLYMLFEVLLLFSIMLLYIDISKVENKDVKKNVFVLKKAMPVVLVVLLLLSMYESFSAYFNSSMVLLDRVCGDINTHDQLDYVPVCFTKESYASDTAYLKDSNGNPVYEGVESLSLTKIGTHIDYNYTSHSKDIYGVFQLTYYMGYKAYNENGRELPVVCSDNGRVSVALEEGGPHSIHISFKVKPVFTVLYIIMLAGWVIYITRIFIKPSG